MHPDLVERARSGDRETFGQLAGGKVDPLLAVARRIWLSTMVVYFAVAVFPVPVFWPL